MRFEKRPLDTPSEKKIIPVPEEAVISFPEIAEISERTVPPPPKETVNSFPKIVETLPPLERKRIIVPEKKKEEIKNSGGYFKKMLLVGALSISVATYLSTRHEDYSDYKTFNEAFSKARKDGHDKFKWNDNVYTTDLVNKEISDTYWKSKKFLEEYYSSDYFKQKILTAKDSSAVASEVKIPFYNEYQKNYRLYRTAYEEWQLDPSEKNQQELDVALNNLNIAEEKFNNVHNSPEYSQAIDSTISHFYTTTLENLNRPEYFSITSQKGDKHQEEGSYNREKKKLFIYDNPADNDNTTAPHELAHKAANNGLNMSTYRILELKNRAEEAFKRNLESFLKKYSNRQENIDYYLDPIEIDARQNAARFWLFTHYPNYKPDTRFEGKHYDFLMRNYHELPWDMRLILDLFLNKDIFIENMNKY